MKRDDTRASRAALRGVGGPAVLRWDMRPWAVILMLIGGVACGTALSASAQAVSALSDGAARAAEPDNDPNRIPTVKISLYPAAEPSPALKYQLLPPALVRRPGNAAVHYGKVKAEQNALFSDTKRWEKIAEWSGTPLDKFPAEEVRKQLASLQYHLERAARCETCDWDLPIREQPFFGLLLPEAQESRQFGRYLAARARLQIVDKKYDEAVETLQCGYALGRHVAEGQTLVNAMVGIAICGVMDAIVQEMMQRPDAPNLYWALSALPRPLVDMRKGFEAEMYALYYTFPELRDLDKKQYGSDYWKHLSDKLATDVLQWGGDQQPRGAQQMLTTATAMMAYPKAKASLVRRGRTAAEVEAMPVAQVVLFDAVQTYEELRDQMFKALYLSYPEGKRHIAEAERMLREARAQGREIIPLASLLLPAVGAAKGAEVRLQREIAVLRIFEALRMHAAANRGALPESLKEVTVAAIPSDPVRDEPFVYHRLDPHIAILEVIGPLGPGQYYNGVRYEITMKQKGK